MKKIIQKYKYLFLIIIIFYSSTTKSQQIIPLSAEKQQQVDELKEYAEIIGRLKFFKKQLNIEIEKIKNNIIPLNEEQLYYKNSYIKAMNLILDKIDEIINEYRNKIEKIYEEVK